MIRSRRKETMSEDPEFTEKHFYEALFNPSLAREIHDYGKAQGWDNPINLLEIPRAEWDKWLNHRLVLPDGIASFCEGQSEFNALEIQNLEAALETHYTVTNPYYISLFGQVALFSKE